MAFSRMRVNLFGGFEIRVSANDGTETTHTISRFRQEYFLLAYVFSSGGRASRSDISSAFQEHSPADEQDQRVSNALTRLRKDLQEKTGLSEADRGIYLSNTVGFIEFNSSLCSSDVGDFLKAYEEARKETLPEKKAALYGKAADLYAQFSSDGDLLSGFDWNWIPKKRKELQGFYERALLRQKELLEALPKADATLVSPISSLPVNLQSPNSLPPVRQFPITQSSEKTQIVKPEVTLQTVNAATKKSIEWESIAFRSIPFLIFATVAVWIFYPMAKTAMAPDNRASKADVVKSPAVRISFGGIALDLRDETGNEKGISEDKKKGCEAFRAKKWDEAIDAFTLAFDQKDSSDPETLIFLNNAKAQESGSMYTVCVAASLKSPVTWDSGKEMLRGVAQIQNKINLAGGIGGRLIRVMIAEDFNTPEETVKTAKEVANDPEVLAVIGHFKSEITKEALPIYIENGIVSVSPSSSSSRLTRNTPTGWFYRTSASDEEHSVTLSNYVKRHFPKPKGKRTRVAIYFRESSDYSASIKEEFVKRLSTDDYDCHAFILPTNMEPQSVIQDAKRNFLKSSFDLIALFPDADTRDAALEIAEMFDGVKVAGDSMDAGRINSIPHLALKGVIPVCSYFSGNLNAGFSKEANQFWGIDHADNWRMVTSYEAMIAVTKAIEIASKSGSVTRETVRLAMQRLPEELQGVDGNKIAFKPDGNRIGRGSQLGRFDPSLPRFVLLKE